MDIVFIAIPILFAITIHEYAHGWMAYRLGDYTAKSLGRLTINPIPHVDPIGTIVVPLVLYYTSGFIFGWAKPVPINYAALKDKKTGVLKVSLAGPISNAIMAIFWIAMFYVGINLNAEFLVKMASIGVFFNLLLGLFNMLPLPPLDGSAMVRQYIPYRYRDQWDQLEMYGIFIVMGLVLLGVVGTILLPIIDVIMAQFPLLREGLILAMRG